MQADRAALFHPLGEIVTGQHPGDRVAAGQLHDGFQLHLVEPLGLESDLGFTFIEDLPGLVEIGLGGRVDLFFRQLLARHVLA